MAEFSEVMRHWDRMCESTDCTTCDMESADQYRTCTGFAKYNPKRAEEIIMKWAAENPEPAYPTWYRWLIMMGAVGSIKDLFLDLQKPIPPDIAKQLGIKP